MKIKVNDNAQAYPRRTLIKALAGGTVAGGVLMPARWTKPVVDTVLMPAHAQVSPGQDCNVGCDFRLRLEWETDDTIDMDLELLTPGGTRIAPKGANGARMGRCLQHDGDAAIGEDQDGLDILVAEEITNINPSFVAPGRYRIFVRVLGPTFEPHRLSASVCGQNQSCEGNLRIPGVYSAGSINISTGGTAALNLNCPVVDE